MRQTKFMVFPRVRLGRNYHSSVNQCVFTVVRENPVTTSFPGSLFSASLWRWRNTFPATKGMREPGNDVAVNRATSYPRNSLHSRGRERTLGTQQQAAEMRVVGKTFFHLLCGLHTKIQARASPSSSTMVNK